MAAKKQTKKSASMSNNQKLVVGVGLTAAAVTAAGVYFLQGSKDAKKNRKKVKSWMLHAKAEVLEKLEDAQEMTHEEFEDLVDGVSATYSKLKDASKADIKDFTKEMQEHWPKIVKEGKAVTAMVSGVVGTKKKAAPKKKPAAKKAPKKAAAKKPAKKTVPKKKPAKK